jgi:hypothetical protein
VFDPPSAKTNDLSIPSDLNRSIMEAPKGSSPTFMHGATRRPWRRNVTAAFMALPPVVITIESAENFSPKGNAIAFPSGVPG